MIYLKIPRSQVQTRDEHKTNGYKWPEPGPNAIVEWDGSLTIYTGILNPTRQEDLRFAKNKVWNNEI